MIFKAILLQNLNKFIAIKLLIFLPQIIFLIKQKEEFSLKIVVIFLPVIIIYIMVNGSSRNWKRIYKTFLVNDLISISRVWWESLSVQIQNFHFLCEMLIFASFCMEIKMNNLFTFHVYAYFMALRKQKTNIVKRDNKIVNMAYVGWARA